MSNDTIDEKSINYLIDNNIPIKFSGDINDLINAIGDTREHKNIRKVIINSHLNRRNSIQYGFEYSIRKGFVETAKLFKKLGAKVDQEKLDLLLYDSIDYESSVKYLLTISTIHPLTKLQMLFTAAEQSRLSILQLLISKINYAQEDLNRALVVACNHFNNQEVIKYLIEIGADLSFNDYEPVKNICHSENLELIKYINSTSNIFKNQKSDIFLYHSHKPEVIKYLFKIGITVKPNKELSPIWLKSSFSNDDLLNKLIDQYSLINKITDSIISSACRHDDMELIDVLLDRGVEKEPLMLLMLIHSLADKNYKWAEYAIQNGADINFDNDHIFRQAILMNNINIIEFLIRNGANIHANNDEALCNACAYNYYKIAYYLIKNGANVNTCNGKPLKLASSFRDSYIEPSEDPFLLIKLLVESGADIHAGNEEALVNVCLYKPNLNTIKYLIDKGASVNKVKNIILSILRENGGKEGEEGEIYNYIASLAINSLH